MPNRGTGERGVYITLVAIFGLILIGLTALVIDLGFVAVAQTRLQHVVNLAALSAIEQYVRSDAGESDRRTAAMSRANTILQANSVWGIDSSELIVDEESVKFGSWYREAPAPDGGCAKYPCFKESAGTQGNAVRIVVRNRTDNPVIRIFSQVFGTTPVTIEAEATATIVKRCMGFLLDLSLSATAETHVLPARSQFPVFRPDPPVFPAPLDPIRDSVAFYGKTYEPNEAPPCYNSVECEGGSCDEACDGVGRVTAENDPPNLGLFARVVPPANPDVCTFSSLFPAPGRVDYHQLLWCSLPRDRLIVEGRVDPPFSPGHHYRSDFVPRDTPWNNTILFNLQTKPEPFSTFLNAFNSALRSVYAESSNADEAMLGGFSKDFVLQGENRTFPTSGLVKGNDGIALLTHITNINNIGWPGGDPEVKPHVLEVGIFPMFGLSTADGQPTQGQTETNLAGAIEKTIVRLNERCGVGDRKIIVVATDGLANCRPNYPSFSSWTCRADYIGYRLAEGHLLRADSMGTLGKLVESRVALTILHAGNSVRPNFKKVATACPDQEVEGDQCLLDYDAALRGGYSSGLIEYQGFRECDTEARSFIDCRSIQGSNTVFGTAGPCPQQQLNATNFLSGCEANILANINSPGNFFVRPAMMLAELAVRSGGRYCPIVPVGETTDYIDHDGDASTPKRLKASAVEGDAVTHSLELLSPGEQAGACAQLAVGGNPFILVEE